MDDRFRPRLTPLSGLFLLERKPVEDARGSLQRLYCRQSFGELGAAKPLDQINITATRKRGAVRGMHFQFSPHAEIKIVSCLRGKVFDVAVDLRRGSPTFLKWHGVTLAPELYNSLLIPEGFAHGFQALTSDVELLYFHTASYQKEAEGGVSPADPRLSITWPLDITEISPRDAGHPPLTADYQGVEL